MAELAAQAEARGWDGFFIWDHVAYRPPVRAIADPWITLSAIAIATERLRIGALVTPLPRRRPHQVARETATLDRLSGGRLVFGIGVGSESTEEFKPERFGEEGDMRKRAVLLDEGLERLCAYWEGEFEPRPVQRPRIPIWVAARWPNRRPLRRAARWDGLFPIDMPGPEALGELAAEVEQMRGSLDGYELAAEVPAGTDPAPWEQAGATWCLTAPDDDLQPTAAAVREAIESL
jgi:alkanesulfonate monooxygenase SsuD/methylene tetrahydromethanopterin reductase-like flavin-dependent oxidoreductase (luciferase family)